MSRARRTWWSGITPAGLLVTLTICLAAVAATGAVVYRYCVDGKLDPAGAAFASGLVGNAGILLSRSRPDPAATIEQPATLTASSEPGDPG